MVVDKMECDFRPFFRKKKGKEFREPQPKYVDLVSSRSSQIQQPWSLHMN
jgi:hypothetical protein